MLAIDSDTLFVADSIQEHILNYGWKVFLIKGRMLPSEAEFHFYGAYQDNKVKVCDFFSVEVEFETILIKYIVEPKKITVYGRQWDTIGLDDGNKPPKKLQVLLKYP